MRGIIITIIILIFTAPVFIKIFPTQQNRQSQNQALNTPVQKKTILAQNLDIPWAIAFLPDKRFLVTQRAGQVLLFQPGSFDGKVITTIDGVKNIGEGGLLGIAVHPNFAKNNYIYLYYTYSSDRENTLNRVSRFKLVNEKLSDKTVIVDVIPGAANHNGGRLKFGPDNNLYITTGDAQNPSLSQNINSLAGKILRVTDAGEPVTDNPFNNEVFSYGHRNPQGLAWDDKGQLWETEHGPSAKDELNKIEKGANYGWPLIQGDQEQEGMQSPVIQSGVDTWAPSGMTFYRGVLYFGGLRGQALYSFNPNNRNLKTNYKGEFGRLREVVNFEDNLYIATSNKDGRGAPNPGDDKILRMGPWLPD